MGLIAWAIKRDTGLTSGQKKIVLASCLVFIACLLSWLLSEYDLIFKKIEPDTRFLLFGLTLIAVSLSGVTINQFFIALIIAGISYGCSGLYERYYLGVNRVNGDENAVTFGNGAFLIAACLMMIYLTRAHKALKLVAPIAIIFALIASAYSGTRGSFLALLPLMIIMGYKFNHKGRFAVIIFTMISIIGIGQFTSIMDRFEHGKNNVISYLENGNVRTASGQRLGMWEASLCILKHDPIWGSGPRTYRAATNNKDKECGDPAIKHNNQAHSIIFNTLATKGIIGFISLILFLTTLIYFTFKERSPARFILLAAVVSMLSYGLTVDLIFKVYMADKHLVLLAIIVGLARRKT